jgi:pathogenesis-related protein 1
MNQARAAVGETALHWDPIAAQVALAWASQCMFMHNPNASTQYASMGGTGGLGENVASGAPTQTVAAAVASWLGEKASYNHATNTCASGQQCGHYTQIVWSTTTGVGCAKVHCTTNSPFGAQYPAWDNSVCNFSPPGNYVGVSPY